MRNIFQQILQMCIYGSIAIMAVLILRKCFNKLPKRITCLFWIIPGFRLICPLNFKSVFSVLNIALLRDNTDATNYNMAFAAPPVYYAAPYQSTPRHNTGADTSARLLRSLSDPKTILALIWLTGMIAILAYLTVKTVRFVKVLKTATLSASGNYYVSDIVDTSFVFGLFRPKIYMQSGLTREEESYILQHERMHIKNLDHITRIIGVMLVCVYWFNPLIWLGFVKMCADLEMRCDEAVIDRMGTKIKKEYCLSMVRHASDRDTVNRGVYAAFAGDNYNGKEIKMRINNLSRYKKVSRIAAVAVIVFSLGITVALSTKAQGRSDDTVEPVEETSVSDFDSEDIAPAVEGEVKIGAPVSTPGNLPPMTTEENLANYGKEIFEIPDDVVYSDEGRPYSNSYDYKDIPEFRVIGAILEKEGFEVSNCEGEFLDQDGNVQYGRELYCFYAYKEENSGESMNLHFYMVSDEYASDDFGEIDENHGLYSSEIFDGTVDGWYMYRVYDPQSHIMMDATGDYAFDWEAMGLFDAIK